MFKKRKNAMHLCVFYVMGPTQYVVVQNSSKLLLHIMDVADAPTQTIDDIQKHFLQAGLGKNWAGANVRDNEVMCRFTHAQDQSHVFCVVYKVSHESVTDISDAIWMNTMGNTPMPGLRDLLVANTKASFDVVFRPVHVAVAFGSTLMIGVGVWSLLTMDTNKKVLRAYLSHQKHVKQETDYEQRRRQAQVMLEDISLKASHDRQSGRM